MSGTFRTEQHFQAINVKVEKFEYSIFRSFRLFLDNGTRKDLIYEFMPNTFSVLGRKTALIFKAGERIFNHLA